MFTVLRLFSAVFTGLGRGKAAPAAGSWGKDQEDSGRGARGWWLEAPQDAGQLQQGTCILPLGEGALNEQHRHKQHVGVALCFSETQRGEMQLIGGSGVSCSGSD